MKLSFILLLFSFLVLAGSTQELRDDFGNGKDTTSVTILNPSEANRLFKEFQSQDQIPFNYPRDGCYARATAMARIAEKENINMGKVYAEGFLRAKTKNPVYKTVEWGWHVAPVAYVKNGEKNQLMVFDPSLFKKPVTEDEWLNAMKEKGLPPAEITEVYHGSRFQFYAKEYEKQKKSWYSDDLKKTKDTMERYLAIQKQQVPPIDDEQAFQLQKSQNNNQQQIQWGTK